jgi:hypothetical protein
MNMERTPLLNPRKIIWSNGLPRSGTSWLCQILDSAPEVAFRLAPLFSWQFRGRMQPTDPVESWRTFFTEVLASVDPWLSQQERRKAGKFPVFTQKEHPAPVLVVKDVRHHEYIPHLLQLDLPFHVVHIIRDPRAAIHSWLTNPKEFPQEADPMTHWRTGAIRKINPSEYWGFEDWKRLTLLYQDLSQRHPDKVHLIHYEELIDAPAERSRELFERLGLQWTGQTEAFLSTSTSRNSDDPFSVYKDPSVKVRWRGALQEEIQRAIEDELRDTSLAIHLRS